MSVKRLVPTNVYTSSLAPSVAREGDLYFDTVSSKLKIYFAGAWNALAFLSDLDIIPSLIDGGMSNTMNFENSYDGGMYNTTTFDGIIDGGVFV